MVGWLNVFNAVLSPKRYWLGPRYQEVELGGGGGREGGDRSRLYLTLHSHHQNDSCIKMGSDEGPHFNVSLPVRDKDTRLLSKDNYF